jgi:YggT family protein
MLYALVDIIITMLTILSYIVVAGAILSWLVAFNVINTHNDFVRALLHALDRITEPLLRPIRRILPDFGALDLSPMVLLFSIWIVQRLLQGAVDQYAMSSAGAM